MTNVFIRKQNQAHEHRFVMAVPKQKSARNAVCGGRQSGLGCVGDCHQLIPMLVKILINNPCHPESKMKHERKCWDCGNVAEHEDNVVPHVLCKKCGSQDTRAVKKPVATVAELHPVQLKVSRDRAHLNSKVTLLAYEVYCALFGAQAAMVTGECRGGFSAGELLAFLYARNFPRAEWRARVDEAFQGMMNL